MRRGPRRGRKARALDSARASALGSRLAAGLASVLALVFASATPQTAVAGDRERELEGLRERIEDSRERVTGHEAAERAVLEELEEVDRRLADGLRERDAARREVDEARARLEVVRPKLAQTQRRLARTQGALAARAVALYREGEFGAVRVLFAADSLRDWMARAALLRRLVHHDASLVGRSRRERDALAAVEAEAKTLVARREAADAKLTRWVAALDQERRAKGSILARVRRDRTAERRLLVELEQAAEALEATIKSLGARAAEDGSSAVPQGGGLVRGALPLPVAAPIAQRFGRVVDPEFQTETRRGGVDFAAAAGAPVASVARGVVRFAGWFRGYGRIVILDHGDAYHSVSGHLDEILVRVDDVVAAGQAIGTVGETGSLAGPSLYFELRRGGAPIDPEPWFARTVEASSD